MTRMERSMAYGIRERHVDADRGINRDLGFDEQPSAKLAVTITVGLPCIGGGIYVFVS